MSHALNYLVNCSIMFTELPLLQRPGAAKAAGFDAIEFWWPFADSEPAAAEVDAFVSAVSDAGVRLVGLNFAAGDMPGGDRGLLSWSGRQDEFRRHLPIAIDIGARLSTSNFNALYGNRLGTVPSGEQDDLALENLAAAAAAAKRVGANVLLEPVSGAPRYPLRTAADVLTVIDRAHHEAGIDNVRLLADLYHLFVNGDDVATVIAAHTPRIGHVQIADAPGRHEPGTGDIPVAEHLDALAAAGYTGWVGLEYIPSDTTQASLAWLPRSRRSSIEKSRNQA